MDYAKTYQNNFIHYYESGMQLHVDYDAAFLVLPNVKICIAGYFLLLYHKNSPHSRYLDNGPLLIECRTLRSVVTSAVETETHGVFHLAKLVLMIIHILTEMNHPQSEPTPIRTDNSTSAGFTNKNIVMNRFKFWDIQLHWILDKKTSTFQCILGQGH